MAPPGVDYADRLRACEHLTEQLKRSGRKFSKANEMAGIVEAEMNKRATTKEQYSALLDQCLHRVKSCVEQHVSREEHTSATSQQAPLALEAGPLMQQPALPQALPPPLAPTESDPSARWHTLSALTDNFPLSPLETEPLIEQDATQSADEVDALLNAILTCSRISVQPT